MALVRSIRIGKVLVPRSTSHESIGPRIAPAAFCTNFIHSTSSACFSTMMPPTLSLCPLRNLVVLWVTMSQPELERALNVWARERVVDDHADPVAWAMAQAAGRSVIRSIGLVGVSMNRYLVFRVIAGSMSQGATYRRR